jgi:hypothetical protein
MHWSWSASNTFIRLTVKKQQERDFGVDDTSKDSFSDEQLLECLAQAFGSR